MTINYHIGDNYDNCDNDDNHPDAMITMITMLTIVTISLHRTRTNSTFASARPPSRTSRWGFLRSSSPLQNPPDHPPDHQLDHPPDHPPDYPPDHQLDAWFKLIFKSRCKYDLGSWAMLTLFWTPPSRSTLARPSLLGAFPGRSRYHPQRQRQRQRQG